MSTTLTPTLSLWERELSVPPDDYFLLHDQVTTG
jgi:hypothetical protein